MRQQVKCCAVCGAGRADLSIAIQPLWLKWMRKEQSNPVIGLYRRRKSKDVRLPMDESHRRWCNGELRASPAISRGIGQVNPDRMQGWIEGLKVVRPLLSNRLRLWVIAIPDRWLSKTEHGLRAALFFITIEAWLFFYKVADLDKIDYNKKGSGKYSRTFKIK